MTWLAVVLRDYGEPLEADIHRFHQRELGDLWRGKLSGRQLGVWAAHLPPEAAIWRAMNVDVAWSPNAHMAALAADRLAEVIAMLGGKDTYPVVRRPGDPAPEDDISARQRHAEDQASAWEARQKDRARFYANDPETPDTANIADTAEEAS